MEWSVKSLERLSSVKISVLFVDNGILQRECDLEPSGPCVYDRRRPHFPRILRTSLIDPWDRGIAGRQDTTPIESLWLTTTLSSATADSCHSKLIAALKSTGISGFCGFVISFAFADFWTSFISSLC